MKTMGSCYRYERRIHTKEREGIPVVKRRERGGVQVQFEQLRKRYIRPSKLPQMAPVFFVGKKNSKKRIV